MKRKINRSARLLAAVASAALVRAATASTIRDDVPDSLYTALSAQPQYAASGYVDVTSSPHEFSSGTLIAPDWVLTAAHGVTVNESSPAFAPALITFGQGAAANLTVGPDAVTQVIVDPDYDGSSIDGGDLALLQLATPITNVAPAVLYNSSLGSLIGQTTTAVGYGYTGTGLTGYNVNTLGTRRAFTNVFDASGGGSTVGGPPQFTNYDFTNINSDFLLTDFDQPSNPSASLMGDTNPTALEGASTPGDSGGGAFVTVNGQTYLAGVGDFVGAFDNNPLSTAANGYYGDFNGYTSLIAPRSAAFLAENLVTTSAWSAPSGGSWASLSNWANNVPPEFAQATATFGSAIQNNSTVTLDADWTVGQVNFTATNSYTLAAGAGGVLVLDNGGGAATAVINVAAGSPFISAPIAGPGNVQITGAGMLTLSGQNTYAGATTISGGTLVIAAANSLPATTALTIGPCAAGVFAPGIGAATIASLTINSGGTLNLTNNALLINYGSASADPESAVAGYLASGALKTSAATAGKFALGYADSDIDSGTTLEPNQLLIAYTLAGDANLDGSVGFADLVSVAEHFGMTGQDWSQGNFTYDAGGSVGFADLVLVAENFGETSSIAQDRPVISLSPVWQDATAVVPEPAGLAMFAILLLPARRRRL